MADQRILSVGQCAADHGAIRWSIQAHFPDARLIGVATREEAIQHLQTDRVDVVLVNRVFDADGDSGIDFITQLKQEAKLSSVPVLLVSNYEDAQEQAMQVGALSGFGKSSLGQPRMIEALQAALDSQVN